MTERGTVYLMGLVTRREADLATEVARTTSGARPWCAPVPKLHQRGRLKAASAARADQRPLPACPERARRRLRVRPSARCRPTDRHYARTRLLSLMLA